MKIGDIFMEGVTVGWIDAKVTFGKDAQPIEYPPDTFDFHGMPGPDTGDEGEPVPQSGKPYAPGRHSHGTVPGGDDTVKEQEHKPTFRRGIGPGSINHPREHLEGPPKHFNLSDIKSTTEGGGRSKFREELANNPALREKILRIMRNEQGVHPEGTQGIAESMMNRAYTRGTPLEQAARWVTEGRRAGGYYDDSRHPRGGGPLTASQRATLDAALERALGGSNITNNAVDNASGNFARGEIRDRRFEYRAKIHEEYFLVPTLREQRANRQAWDEWMSRGAPLGGGIGPTAQPISRRRRSPGEASKDEPTFANQPIKSAVERDRSTDTFADIHRPGNVPQHTGEAAAPSGSDLEYLRGHGAHSTIGGARQPLGTHTAVNAEFAARLAAAGRAYTAQTGREPNYGEADRDIATQWIYWERYHHDRSRVAYPGTSRHQRGEAIDIGRGPFLDWMHTHGQHFGLHYPVLRTDPVHTEMDRRYPGNFQRQQTTAASRPVPTPPAAATPPGGATPPAAAGGRGTMLFLHGMQSRYGSTPPAQIEAQARRYATARNMNLEVVDVSGDQRQRQRAMAQARINRGGISAVLGFSAGGYTTQHLTGVSERIAVGAPGVAHNVRLPGRHMEQVEQLARTQERSARHD